MGYDDAFGTIHDRYRQRLLAYTRQMLGPSRSDAEDVLQDVFLRAYGALRNDNRPVTLRAWLYRVAHNRCIDHLRRPVPPAAEIYELSRTPAHDPQAETVRREDLRRLVQDVQRLPEQQRSALLMRELDGLTYAELADALDTSVPAIKSLLVRARVGLVEAEEARDTACVEIRADLVRTHGRGVRTSGRSRRHLRDCNACREYRQGLRGVDEGARGALPGRRRAARRRGQAAGDRRRLVGRRGGRRRRSRRHRRRGGRGHGRDGHGDEGRRDRLLRRRRRRRRGRGAPARQAGGALRPRGRATCARPRRAWRRSRSRRSRRRWHAPWTRCATSSSRRPARARPPGTTRSRRRPPSPPPTRRPGAWRRPLRRRRSPRRPRRRRPAAPWRPTRTRCPTRAGPAPSALRRPPTSAAPGPTTPPAHAPATGEGTNAGAPVDAGAPMAGATPAG